ncbi:hypothetical protein DFH27DRAFT_616452 [Peziza echinospora]|nr:hypothetical protein DFH27DRAFT_616452 [Peziza echinospora]
MKPQSTAQPSRRTTRSQGKRPNNENEIPSTAESLDQRPEKRRKITLKTEAHSMSSSLQILPEADMEDCATARPSEKASPNSLRRIVLRHSIKKNTATIPVAQNVMPEDEPTQSDSSSHSALVPHPSERPCTRGRSPSFSEPSWALVIERLAWLTRRSEPPATTQSGSGTKRRPRYCTVSNSNQQRRYVPRRGPRPELEWRKGVSDSCRVGKRDRDEEVGWWLTGEPVLVEPTLERNDVSDCDTIVVTDLDTDDGGGDRG